VSSLIWTIIGIIFLLGFLFWAPLFMMMAMDGSGCL